MMNQQTDDNIHECILHTHFLFMEIVLFADTVIMAKSRCEY